MARTPCEKFREDFRTGFLSGHPDVCESCRAWAEDIMAVREMGLDLPLPHGLKASLLRVAEGVNPRHIEADAATVEKELPLPMLKMPPQLAARLLSIPSERRSKAKPTRLISATSAAAASLLVASLLASVLGGEARDTAASASGLSLEVGRSIETVGNCCTTLAIGAGMGLSRSVSIAGKTAGELVGRLSPPEKKSYSPTRRQETTGRGPSGDKEKYDGKREADR